MLLPACLTDNASFPSAYFLSSHRFCTNLTQFHLTKVFFFSRTVTFKCFPGRCSPAFLVLSVTSGLHHGVGFNNDRPSSSTVFGTWVDVVSGFLFHQMKNSFKFSSVVFWAFRCFWAARASIFLRMDYIGNLLSLIAVFCFCAIKSMMASFKCKLNHCHWTMML